MKIIAIIFLTLLSSRVIAGNAQLYNTIFDDAVKHSAFLTFIACDSVESKKIVMIDEIGYLSESKHTSICKSPIEIIKKSGRYQSCDTMHVIFSQLGKKRYSIVFWCKYNGSAVSFLYIKKRKCIHLDSISKGDF